MSDQRIAKVKYVLVLFLNMFALLILLVVASGIFWVSTHRAKWIFASSAAAVSSCFLFYVKRSAYNRARFLGAAQLISGKIVGARSSAGLDFDDVVYEVKICLENGGEIQKKLYLTHWDGEPEIGEEVLIALHPTNPAHFIITEYECSTKELMLLKS